MRFMGLNVKSVRRTVRGITKFENSQTKAFEVFNKIKITTPRDINHLLTLLLYKFNE
ncbi:hypothetical protein GGGNBK_03440 [Sporosarcina sp. ANT_H38]